MGSGTSALGRTPSVLAAKRRKNAAQGVSPGFSFRGRNQARSRRKTINSRTSYPAYFFYVAPGYFKFMRTISWPQFARQFPQASTGKTHPPQFLHKSEAIFCCEAQRSAAEWVHRKRWNSQRLPNDDCGDAGGSWQFSRVNCQGKSENARERVPVARALRPPLLPAQ
jgi:hypothetical protein